MPVRAAVGDHVPQFPLEWALKDLAIASAQGDTLPLLDALSRQWRAAVDAGHGREDVSAAHLMLSGRDCANTIGDSAAFRQGGHEGSLAATVGLGPLRRAMGAIKVATSASDL
jgi:hypothetical protein